MSRSPKSFIDYAKMLERCQSLEAQGKQTWVLQRKAQLFLQAAKIREKLGHREAASFCMANYLYAEGSRLLEQKEIRKATEHLWRSTELFIELEIAWMSLHALHGFMRAYGASRDFSWRNLEKVEMAVSRIDEFLDKSNSLRNSSVYLIVKFRLLEQKAILLAKRKTLESLQKSVTLQNKAKRLAKSLGDETQEIVAGIELQIVIAKIKMARLLSKDPLEISKLYFSAAEMTRARIKGKEKFYFEHLADAHKFSALHYLDSSNFPAFLDHIDKSLEYARKARNDATYWFALGLKNRVEAKFEKQFERKAKCLKLAKECFHKSGDRRTGRIAEYYLHLAYASHLVSKGRLDAYLKALVKVSRSAKSAGYSTDFFEMEKTRLQALTEVRKGNFNAAADFYGKYTGDLRKKSGETRFYERMNHICKIIQFLSRSSFTQDDLIEIVNSIRDVSEKKLGEFLLHAYTRLNTLVSMYMSSLSEVSILRNLREQIVRLILGQEEDVFSRREIEDLGYLSQYEWYQKYPEHIINAYESFEWFLLDCPIDLKDAAFNLFYRRVLEPLLRLIVEFNSKLEWKDNWELELEKITQDSRPIDKYTLGKLVQCIHRLKSKSDNYCNQLGEETEILLDKHLKIRNRLTHASINLEENLMKKEIRSLLYKLRICTPALLLVQQRRGRGYRARLLWRRSPYQVQLRIPDDLKKNIVYYTSPHVSIDKRQFVPEVLIAAKEGNNQYTSFQNEIGRIPNLARYKEYIFLRKEGKSLVKLKEIVANAMITARDVGQDFSVETFENLFARGGQLRSLRMLSTSPRQMMYFLWGLFRETFRIISEKPPHSFRIVSMVFESLLMIMN